MHLMAKILFVGYSSTYIMSNNLKHFYIKILTIYKYCTVIYALKTNLFIVGKVVHTVQLKLFYFVNSTFQKYTFFLESQRLPNKHFNGYTTNAVALFQVK